MFNKKSGNITDIDLQHIDGLMKAISSANQNKAPMILDGCLPCGDEYVIATDLGALELYLKTRYGKS